MKTKLKRHPNAKLDAPTLTGMRAAIAPSLDLNRQLRRNDELRDDDALLSAADQKRARKAAAVVARAASRGRS